MRGSKKCMTKPNKTELEAWVNDCNDKQCNHDEEINNYYADTQCEQCKTSANVISCGHTSGTRYACLSCGQRWEFLK